MKDSVERADRHMTTLKLHPRLARHISGSETTMQSMNEWDKRSMGLASGSWGYLDSATQAHTRAKVRAQNAAKLQRAAAT